MAVNTTSPGPIKLTVSYKVVWGIAALGLSTISGTFGALQPIFFQDYLGLQARWIGIAAVIYAVWNAVNDPLFGYITDSTRSKRGRRIPYMRFTAPFLALTFILVWFAPPQAGQQALFWWMLVPGSLALVTLLGKNTYCGWICPFGGILELVARTGGMNVPVPRNLQRQLKGAARAMRMKPMLYHRTCAISSSSSSVMRWPLTSSAV